jgi:hypothetical protein
VAVVDDVNRTTARIGDGAGAARGDVEADGSITLKSQIQNRPDVGAGSGIDEATSPAGAADGTKFAGSAAVAIGDYDNFAEAYINDGAEVDAGGAIAVTAEALNDYEFVYGVNLFEALTQEPDHTTDDGSVAVGFDEVVEVKDAHAGEGTVGNWYRFKGVDGATVDLANEDFDLPRWEDLGARGDYKRTNFIANLTTYTDSNFGADNNITDTWTQSTAKGAELSVAGAVTVLSLDHRARAWIAPGALINQDDDAAFRTGEQDVRIEATSVDQAVHFIGNIEVPGVSGSTKKFTFEKKLLPKTGTGGGDAVGFGVLVVTYDNDVEARIAAGAKVYADSLKVGATNDAWSISLGASGGKSGNVGFNGVFSWISIDNTTYAQIDDGAEVTVGSGTVIEQDADGNDVDTGKSLLVDALDDSWIANIGGGVAVAQNTGIGAAVAVNRLERDTRAFVGNRDGETDRRRGDRGDERWPHHRRHARRCAGERVPAGSGGRSARRGVTADPVRRPAAGEGAAADGRRGRRLGVVRLRERQGARVRRRCGGLRRRGPHDRGDERHRHLVAVRRRGDRQVGDNEQRRRRRGAELEPDRQRNESVHRQLDGGRRDAHRRREPGRRDPQPDRGRLRRRGHRRHGSRRIGLGQRGPGGNRGLHQPLHRHGDRWRHHHHRRGRLEDLGNRRQRRVRRQGRLRCVDRRQPDRLLE